MPQLLSNGITLEYERSGPSDGEPLLLIHGVGAQLIRWPRSLCDALEVAGFHLIRFDNRDIGLSTHMDAAPIPDLVALSAAKRGGEASDLPYTLSDMAADTAGLLDALGIASAHIVGASLGGMIAQVLAIEHPDRVRSMAIFMSQSGNPDLPGSHPDALAGLAAPAPDPRADEAAYIEHMVALNRALGSPAYPACETHLRDVARLSALRSYYPAGGARQLAAGRASPDRREALAEITIPTLVIHGTDDPLMPMACGQDIAAHIPRSWFLALQGMGHDLPDELTDIFVSAIAANARRNPHLTT